MKKSEIESAVELRRRSEMSMNKHATRAAGVSQSIDFVFHSQISPFRQRGEGSGTFPTVDFGSQQRRMGTASSGHGRHYLVSDFVRKANDAHYMEAFAKKTETPKAFNVKKTEFTTHIESMGSTGKMIRPSNYTMKAMQDNFKRLM